ncbi:MAG: hypothetical protein WC788_06530 [Candidatus Paceibacterota bacterium]
MTEDEEKTKETETEAEKKIKLKSSIAAVTLMLSLFIFAWVAAQLNSSDFCGSTALNQFMPIVYILIGTANLYIGLRIVQELIGKDGDERVEEIARSISFVAYSYFLVFLLIMQNSCVHRYGNKFDLYWMLRESFVIICAAFAIICAYHTVYLLIKYIAKRDETSNQ